MTPERYVDTISVVSKTVEERRVPKLKDIIEELGNSAVEPVYFALSTNHKEERDNGDPSAIHPIDAMLRPRRWNLEFEHNKEILDILSLHDLAEDYGGGTISGGLALNHWASIAFDGKYYNAANAMTDWYSMIIKSIEKNGPISSKKDPKEITRNDIKRDFRDLKEKICGDFVENQKKALDSIDARINSFESDSPEMGVPTVNKRIGKYLNGLRDSIEEARNNPLSQEEVEKFANKYFSSVERSIMNKIPAVSKKEGDGETLFDKKGSNSFNFAREKAYQLYLSDLASLAAKSYSNGRPYAPIDLFVAKVSDRADNQRVAPSDDSERRVKLSYTKTSMLIDTVEKFLDKSSGYSSKDILNGRNAVKYLKSQLLISMLKDYGKASSFVIDSRDTRRTLWLREEFENFWLNLHQDYISEFEKNLAHFPGKLAIDKTSAKALGVQYENLTGTKLK